MSGFPADYHFHELKKLLGDYKPKANMPCWHCDEPEGAEICFAAAQFAAAAWRALPPGTMPATDALLAPDDPAEPLPEGAAPEDAAYERSLLEDNLFMLRDRVLSGEKIVAAAIKAAGGARLLARGLGVDRKVVEAWTHIPAERLEAIAKITGWPQHVLRPDLFPGVDERQSYGTEEEMDEAWKWAHACQLWLPLPYPPAFLPAHCCARRPRLVLVASK